eukprot:PITA_29746
MPDVEGLRDPIDPPPSEPSTTRKRPLLIKNTLEDAEKHIAPRRTFRESKKPNRCEGYLAAMSTIVQSEPCTFEEAVKHQVWKDAMNEDDVDPNLYFKVEKDKPLILVLYVDDLFLTGDDPLIHQCKRELASEFEMKYLGPMHYFLGLEVWQKPGEIFISQGKYIVKLLERYGMVDCKSVTTPTELNFKKLCGSVAGPELANPTEYRQLVGAMMFLVNSRPDICFAVNTLIQYMVEPHHIHWIDAKNLLRYLRGTIHYGLRYTTGDLRLHGYTDVNWAGSVVDRKSMSGCCFYILHE